MSFKNQWIVLVLMGLSQLGWAGQYSIPPVGAQDDTWSCGANIGARLLSAYGHNVSYAEMQRECPFFEINVLMPVRIGPTPKQLAEFLNKKKSGSRQNFESSRLQDLNELIRFVEDVGPVMILIKSGVENFFGFKVIQLHWVIVSGYDSVSENFTIADTGNQSMTWNKKTLLDHWFWDVGLPTNEEFNSVIKTVLDQHGVYGGMVIQDVNRSPIEKH